MTKSKKTAAKKNVNKKPAKATKVSEVRENKSKASKAVNKQENKVKEFKGPVPQYLELESAIGAALLLSMKSTTHKHIFSHEFEWMIIPAIVSKQFIIFRNAKNEPIAFVSFASVNEGVEKRLLSGTLKLTPAEWRSGDKLYVIDVISPFSPPIEILRQLNSSGKIKSKEVRVLKPGKDGKGMKSELLSDLVKV